MDNDEPFRILIELRPDMAPKVSITMSDMAPEVLTCKYVLLIKDAVKVILRFELANICQSNFSNLNQE